MPINEHQAILQSRARVLRKDQSAAEQRLWYYLRANRFLGLKFKRQRPVGRYIVDFMCSSPALIVEADGGQHSAAREYDRQRDAWLRTQGFHVLRFWNDEVMNQIENVLEAIRLAALATGWEISPHPQPLSQQSMGEGS